MNISEQNFQKQFIISEESRFIKNDLEIPDFEDIPKSTMYGNYKEEFRKIKKIKVILNYSKYNLQEIDDRSFLIYSRFFMFSYFGYILSQRFRPMKFCLFLFPSLLIEVAFRRYFCFSNGIYRKAIYGEDGLSQECRLLLKFFFPTNKYYKLIDERIGHYNERQKNKI